MLFLRYFQDENISMIIILPDTGRVLNNLESNLNKISLISLLNGSESYLGLSLPKFKIETISELMTPSVKLGMENMFEKSANFSGMSDNPLKVRTICHKASIDVNEEGTGGKTVEGTGEHYIIKCEGI